MKHIPKVLRQFTDKLFVHPFQLVVPSDYVAVGYGVTVSESQYQLTPQGAS